MDYRVTLKDKSINCIEIGNKTILLDEKDNWVGRGGTCLVYRAEIQGIDRNGQPLNKKVILKEFYPILSDEKAEYIKRDKSGRIVISNGVRNSQEYIEKRKRFETSYDRFVFFSSQDYTNNYVVRTIEKIDVGNENGDSSLYIIMDYDKAEGFDTFIASLPSLYSFFSMMKKAAEAVSRFHKIGYLHLDLTPSNLLLFSEHTYVKVMDADSIVEKKEVEDIMLSYSDGYTAPEVLERDMWTLREYGEQADVFSLGAIIYRFVMGKRLEYVTEEVTIDRNKAREYLEKFEYEEELENILSRREHCSRYVIKMIKEIIRNSIALNVDFRYENLDEMICRIEEVIQLIEPKQQYILENYHPNRCIVYGRKNKIKEIERKFNEQGEYGNSRIVCIKGIGGIGKSTLAKAYAMAHEDEYNTIVEIWASSARGAIFNTKIINENISDSAEYKRSEEYYQSKKELLSKLMHKEKNKVLYIIHDYNEDNDNTYNDWKELGCDIILTSWNEWSCKTVYLRTDDLSVNNASNAAVEMFEYYYKENARDTNSDNWLKRLDKIIVEEKTDIQNLVCMLGYHPLAIKLLAKQMSYLSGKIERPSEKVREIELYGIEKEGIKFKFDSDKEGAGRTGTIREHLDLIFKIALTSDGLEQNEKTALRFMTIVPSNTGISVSRFSAWTEMGDRGIYALESLKRKGWLEYDDSKKDLLDNVDCKGTFSMPMVIREVVSRQEEFKVTYKNSHMFILNIKKCVSRMGQYYDDLLMNELENLYNKVYEPENKYFSTYEEREQLYEQFKALIIGYCYIDDYRYRQHSWQKCFGVKMMSLSYFDPLMEILCAMFSLTCSYSARKIILKRMEEIVNLYEIEYAEEKEKIIEFRKILIICHYKGFNFNGVIENYEKIKAFCGKEDKKAYAVIMRIVTYSYNREGKLVEEKECLEKRLKYLLEISSMEESQFCKQVEELFDFHFSRMLLDIIDETDTLSMKDLYPNASLKELYVIEFWEELEFICYTLNKDNNYNDLVKEINERTKGFYMLYKEHDKHRYNIDDIENEFRRKNAFYGEFHIKMLKDHMNMSNVYLECAEKNIYDINMRRIFYEKALESYIKAIKIKRMYILGYMDENFIRDIANITRILECAYEEVVNEEIKKELWYKIINMINEMVFVNNISDNANRQILVDNVINFIQEKKEIIEKNKIEKTHINRETRMNVYYDNLVYNADNILRHLRNLKVEHK